MTPTDRAAGYQVRIAAALKHYGATTALNGVYLDVDPGEFTVLLGPGGSGKSSLARALAGIDRLDGGSILFDDEVVSGPRRHIPANRRDLAMVFQDHALWPHLTVLGNVRFALRRRKLDSRTAMTRAREVLDRVGLGAVAERFPHELSGSEQQRVGIARAIVADPALVLLDEPLAHLDANLREPLRLEIAAATRQAAATAIYFTRDHCGAFALADTVGVLNAGRLEQFGPPEEIYHNPRTPFVARCTGISGQVRGAVVGRRGAHLLVRCGEHQLACKGPGRLRDGESVSILIRPTATRLAFTERVDSTGDLVGQVTDVAYRGRGYDHVVDCGKGVLTGVFDSHAWPRGSRCVVRLDPEGCNAFAVSDTPDADVTAVSSMIKRTVPLSRPKAAPLEMSPR